MQRDLANGFPWLWAGAQLENQKYQPKAGRSAAQPAHLRQRHAQNLADAQLDRMG